MNGWVFFGRYASHILFHIALDHTTTLEWNRQGWFWDAEKVSGGPKDNLL
jgi:hypothetical protein